MSLANQMGDAMTFQSGVLGAHDSVKGFSVIGNDGRVGRVSWASYAPGESYLVVTVGRLGRKHHVVPASAVTGVEDGVVNVTLSGADIKRLPDLARPHSELNEQLVAAIELAYARTAGTSSMNF